MRNGKRRNEKRETEKWETSTHLDLDAGTGGQVLRPFAAVLRDVTLRAL